MALNDLKPTSLPLSLFPVTLTSPKSGAGRRHKGDGSGPPGARRRLVDLRCEWADDTHAGGARATNLWSERTVALRREWAKRGR